MADIFFPNDPLVQVHSQIWDDTFQHPEPVVAQELSTLKTINR